jgi:hypothetical protein
MEQQSQNTVSRESLVPFGEKRIRQSYTNGQCAFFTALLVPFFTALLVPFFTSLFVSLQTRASYLFLVTLYH